MKICYICDEYPPVLGGGIGRNIQLYARRLVELGHSVKVLGLALPNDSPPKFELDQGVEVYRFPRPSPDLGAALGRWSIYKQVQEWAKAGEIDMVESPDAKAWVAYWPSLSVPVIVRAHGSASYFAVEMSRKPRPFVRRLERAGLRRSDFWFATSRYTAERTAQILDVRAAEAVIYNAAFTEAHIAEAAAAKETRTRNRIVFTGTLTEKKGIFSLMQAWPKVLERRPDAELHVFGKDSSMGGESMRRINEILPNEAKASVAFRGHVDQAHVRQALRTARAGCFPSYSEAFAMAPMEAMAQGCPTIFSTLSSGPELIRDGVDGLLIHPAKPGEIADAILRLLEDDALCARLGEQGRRRVRESFSLDTVLETVLTFYADCMEQFSERHSRNAA